MWNRSATPVPAALCQQGEPWRRRETTTTAPSKSNWTPSCSLEPGAGDSSHGLQSIRTGALPLTRQSCQRAWPRHYTRVPARRSASPSRRPFPGTPATKLYLHCRPMSTETKGGLPSLKGTLRGRRILIPDFSEQDVRSSWMPVHSTGQAHYLLHLKVGRRWGWGGLGKARRHLPPPARAQCAPLQF